MLQKAGTTVYSVTQQTTCYRAVSIKWFTIVWLQIWYYVYMYCLTLDVAVRVTIYSVTPQTTCYRAVSIYTTQLGTYCTQINSSTFNTGKLILGLLVDNMTFPVTCKIVKCIVHIAGWSFSVKYMVYYSNKLGHFLIVQIKLFLLVNYVTPMTYYHWTLIQLEYSLSHSCRTLSLLYTTINHRSVIGG